MVTKVPLAGWVPWSLPIEFLFSWLVSSHAISYEVAW